MKKLFLILIGFIFISIVCYGDGYWNPSQEFSISINRKCKTEKEMDIIKHVENYYPYDCDWTSETLQAHPIKLAHTLYRESLNYYIDLFFKGSKTYYAYSIKRLKYLAEIKQYEKYELDKEIFYNVYIVECKLEIDYGAFMHTSHIYKERLVVTDLNGNILKIKYDKISAIGVNS